MLTGDCLFVGDIGRPDLAGEELLDEQTRNLYDSLYHKLGKCRPISDPPRAWRRVSLRQRDEFQIKLNHWF